LNNDGIDLGMADPAKESFGFGEFGWKNQYIEGEVSATSTGMEVIHDKGKIGLGEIFGSETRIEGREAEVDSIGTGCGCGLQTLPVPGWG
jgi:hypothetical protein